MKLNQMEEREVCGVWCGGRCGVARGMVVGGRALMEGRIFKEET